MKRINILLCIILFLSACSKREFEGARPDAKLNELRASYSKQLIEAKDGWIGYLFPRGGGGYTFKFNFNDKNRVKTFATIDQQKSVTALESSYRLAADQVLSLYFDTYSYIHQLSDPDETKSGGSRGGGLISDFEFAILKVSQDTIRLKGNHNESDLILIRAKEGEGDDFIKKAFELNTKIDEVNQFRHYYNKIQINNKDYGLIINTEASTVAFYYEDQGVFKSFFTEYAMSAKGIVLRKPFEASGVSIMSLDNFVIDKGSSKATLALNAKTNVSLVNVDKPLLIDMDAPRRMYLTTKSHFSQSGFTIAGKKDALNVRSFPLYAGIIYTPRRYIDPYDILYITFNNGSNFIGPVLNTRYNNQGVLTFHAFMQLTGQNPGSQYVQIARNQNNILFEPTGFYVFQTGNDYYDFVSIKDSKTWIRFK